MTTELMDVVREAVAYHMLGYRNPAEFDANAMVAIMDKLAQALAEFDELLHTAK